MLGTIENYLSFRTEKLIRHFSDWFGSVLKVEWVDSGSKFLEPNFYRLVLGLVPIRTEPTRVHPYSELAVDWRASNRRAHGFDWHKKIQTVVMDFGTWVQLICARLAWFRRCLMIEFLGSAL